MNTLFGITSLRSQPYIPLHRTDKASRLPSVEPITSGLHAGSSILGSQPKAFTFRLQNDNPLKGSMTRNLWKGIV